jgi:hypothetical protein
MIKPVNNNNKTTEVLRGSDIGVNIPFEGELHKVILFTNNKRCIDITKYMMGNSALIPANALKSLDDGELKYEVKFTRNEMSVIKQGCLKIRLKTSNFLNTLEQEDNSKSVLNKLRNG